MEPNAFVAEVYRRMTLRLAARNGGSPPLPPTPARIAEVAKEYRAVLPHERDSAILDIGYGDGWFMAACLQLGYRNVAGADFNVDRKTYMKDWGVKLYRIETSIAELLCDRREEFDFIHLSHVIEHIPKYSLLWIVDALYQALRKGGFFTCEPRIWKVPHLIPATTSLWRTNMDSPVPISPPCCIYAASTIFSLFLPLHRAM